MLITYKSISIFELLAAEEYPCVFLSCDGEPRSETDVVVWQLVIFCLVGYLCFILDLSTEFLFDLFLISQESCRELMQWVDKSGTLGFLLNLSLCLTPLIIPLTDLLKTGKLSFVLLNVFLALDFTGVATGELSNSLFFTTMFLNYYSLSVSEMFWILRRCLSIELAEVFLNWSYYGPPWIINEPVESSD